jgi:hypothetical protein
LLSAGRGERGRRRIAAFFIAPQFCKLTTLPYSWLSKKSLTNQVFESTDRFDAVAPIDFLSDDVDAVWVSTHWRSVRSAKSLATAAIGQDGTWGVTDMHSADDDPLYLSVTVKPDGSGGTDYTYSGGSFFDGLPYKSFTDDYNSTDQLIAQYYYNGATLYYEDTVKPDGSGGTDYTYKDGSFFHGLPYTSYIVDYNSKGELIAQTDYDGATLYLADTIRSDGKGGTDTTYKGGSFFKGRPYTSYTVDDNSSGQQISQSYYKGTTLYLADTVKADGSGGTDFDYHGGSFFKGQPYTSYTIDENSKGEKISESYFDGTTLYLADTVRPDGSGGTDYDYSGGSFFKGLPYTSDTDDYNSSGDLISQSFHDGATLYLADTVKPDGSGGTDYTYKGGSYFDGLPYTSYVEDYNSSGRLTAQKYYNGSTLYLEDTVKPDGSGGTDYTYSGGSYFNQPGLGYSSYIDDFNSKGQLISQHFIV